VAIHRPLSCPRGSGSGVVGLGAQQPGAVTVAISLILLTPGSHSSGSPAQPARTANSPIPSISPGSFLHFRMFLSLSVAKIPFRRN